MMTKLENFEIAFASGGSGCSHECQCGKQFYNPDGGWDWEEGEIERLEKSGAERLDYSVSTVIFEGKAFVLDCTCWNERAEKIISWMDEHKRAFVKYLQLERERKQQEFQDSINPPDNIIYQYGVNAWKAMVEAPKGQTVEVLLKDGKTVTQAHWASDNSGEEQPPFEGWFVKSGISGYSQIRNPIAWRKIRSI